MRGPAFFAYSDNYLIDVKFGIIMDVEASRAIRQAEVGAAKTMIERTEQRFDIKPERLAGDTAYGSGANLDWLVNEAKIAPHIPVVDKSKREDGTFSREDFTSDKIEASFKKGVLTLTLPKKAEAQKPAKKIEVKAA